MIDINTYGNTLAAKLLANLLENKNSPNLVRKVGAILCRINKRVAELDKMPKEQRPFYRQLLLNHYKDTKVNGLGEFEQAIFTNVVKTTFKKVRNG
jgi:hypothetical protein